MSTSTKTPPVQTLRDGKLKAVIWKNPKENGFFYSVDLVRSYQDEAENWKDTHSFSGADLLRISRLAEKAYDRIAELRALDAEHAKAQQQAA